jgi:hypothetical protein
MTTNLLWIQLGESSLPTGNSDAMYIYLNLIGLFYILGNPGFAALGLPYAVAISACGARQEAGPEVETRLSNLSPEAARSQNGERSKVIIWTLLRLTRI